MRLWLTYNSLKPNRVDVFGNYTAKSVDNDFLFSQNSDVYEILDNDPGEKYSSRHVATVDIDSGEIEFNESYVEENLEGLDDPSKYVMLERIEMEVQDDFELDYPSDLGLVEEYESQFQ